MQAPLRRSGNLMAVTGQEGYAYASDDSANGMPRRSAGLVGDGEMGAYYQRTYVPPTVWQRVKTFVRNAAHQPSFVIPLILILFVWGFFRAYVVPSGSMIPTLVEGDRIVGLQTYFPDGGTFDAGDVVTFLSDDNTVYVKRVVAHGGDTVEIRGDTLYVNGEESPYQGVGTGNVQGTWKLADDEYFCMGDNRGNSKDSRYIGPIKANKMIARVVCVFYPMPSAKWLL